MFNDPEFANNIQRNTPRYLRYFEEEADKLMPAASVALGTTDVLDVLEVTTQLFIYFLTTANNSLFISFKESTNRCTAKGSSSWCWPSSVRHAQKLIAQIRNILPTFIIYKSQKT